MKGWHNESYRHSLAAHGISTTHREEFRERAQSIQERILDKFTGPLMYRNKEHFLEDTESSARNMSRQQFIDDFMEAAREYGIDVTPEELSLFYTYLRGGEPYTEYGSYVEYPDIGTTWPHSVRYNDVDFEEAIENLSPNTRINMYHGTDVNTAVYFLKYGMDLDVPPVSPRFPELILIGDSYVSSRLPGMYVSPNPRIAKAFGRVLFEFEVEARDLDPPPDPPVDMELMKNRFRSNEIMWERYPNSFKPGVSNYLLLKGEPQAFLRKGVENENIKSMKIQYGHEDSKWFDISIDDFLAMYGDRL